MINSKIQNSELIFQLIKKYSKLNKNVTFSVAIDIFLKKNCSIRFNEISYFQLIWINYLQNQNKVHLIQSLNRDINIISNKIKEPKALFHLLDLLKSQKSIFPKKININIPKLFPQVQTHLPSDFLCVLNGINGKNFFWSEERKKYVFLGNVEPNYFQLIKEIGRIDSMIKLVKEFIEKAKYISLQNVSNVLENILKKHNDFISKINVKFKYLSGEQLLSLLNSKHIEKIKAASIICNTIRNKYGGCLYNCLDKISKHGDPFFSKISNDMKFKCFEFIEILIKEWMTKGKVNDPYSEFFIKNNPNANLYSNWWADSYYIVQNEIPNILTNESVQLILNTGKSLNLLRKLNKTYDIKTSKLLLFDEFINKCSFEVNQEILKMFNKNNMLIHAFEDINSFILLQRGDFAISFLEIQTDDIFQRISAIIQKFSHHLIKEIDFEVHENDLKLIYKAHPPITIIFGTTEMSIYKSISGLLLKLKRTEYALSHYTPKNKKTSIILFEMHSFICLIQNYLSLQILKKNYDITLQKIGESQSIADILKAHNEYLDKISNGCWVTQSYQSCKLVFFKICEFIYSFLISRNNIIDTINTFHDLIIEFQEELLHQQNREEELIYILKAMFPNIL